MAPTGDGIFQPLAWIRSLTAALPTIGHGGAAVGLILFKHADNDTGVCWPSIGTIAEEGRLGKSKTLRGVAALKAAGLLTVNQVPRKAGGRCMNVYTLTTQPNSGTTEPRPPKDSGTTEPSKVPEWTNQGSRMDLARSTTEPELPLIELPPNELPPVNCPEGKPSRRTLRFDLADRATAEWMFERIRDLDQTFKTPNLDSWANDIRLTRQRDGKTDEEIRELFAWANQNDFWCSNILSPGKLREKWSQLTLKRNASRKPTASQASSARPRGNDYSRFDGDETGGVCAPGKNGDGHAN